MRNKHVIGAGVFLIAFLGSALLYHLRPHPSDQALIDYFHAHRTDFDALVNMAREDYSVRAIYSDQVMLDDFEIWPTSTLEGFSTARLNEYNSVFARLSKYEINSVRKESDQIRLAVSVNVSSFDERNAMTTTKGYAYSVKEPIWLVSSLDEMGFESEGTYYKKINQHWYLYHEWGINTPE